MKMYNLNINLATTASNAANNLLVESTCTTPRTPEILNSLIAMTNPLDNYNFGDDAPKTTPNGPLTNMSSDSNSSSSSQVESPITNNPPSVQHTCSQLIKAGLKLSIEQKRKHQSDGEDLLDLDKVKRIKKNEYSESDEDRVKQDCGIQNWSWYENDDDKLTPEDEERRRRRRERNKIAATKCRLKKRERTANLVNESEILENQNVELKTQMTELQKQKQQLSDMLRMHRPHCQHGIGPATRDAICRLPPVSSVMDNNSFNRPSSVEPNNYRNQNLDHMYVRPASVGVSHYGRSGGTVRSTPSIIVEEINEYQTPDYDGGNYYNNQCLNNNYNNQGYGTSNGLDNGCMA